MDTGKILMGTAMLLITIGLLVHPASAAETGGISPVGQENAIGFAGQVPVCSDTSCLTASESSGSATHPYERLTMAPASAFVGPRDSPTRDVMDKYDR